jgi:hypothetical protein
VASLDPFAHRIESGTVMLFAKEDMDAAAVGLENDDVEDALDAQSYVAESLQELREKIDNVTPEYRYVLEVSEFLYELVPESARIQTGARQLLADRNDAPDAGVLKSKTEQFGDRLNKLTGEQRFVMTTRQLGEAVEMLKVDDPKIEDALDALVADTEELQTLTKNLAYLVTPPPIGIELPEPEPETLLLEKVLGLAAHHKDLSRKTQTVAQEQLAKLAAQQRELASQCEALIPASQSHPNLLAAHRHLIEAVAPLEGADRDAAVISHYEASEVLRYFILEYALKYVVVPPPGGGDDLPGAAKDTPPMEKGLELFMPGVITGTKPKGGRLEWQVIGRRDRAALNENFARELPLEYRAILKDYYERLTE